MAGTKEPFAYKGEQGTAEYYQAYQEWAARHCLAGHVLANGCDCCPECGCDPDDPFGDEEFGPCMCRCHGEEEPGLPIISPIPADADEPIPMECAVCGELRADCRNQTPPEETEVADINVCEECLDALAEEMEAESAAAMIEAAGAARVA